MCVCGVCLVSVCGVCGVVCVVCGGVCGVCVCACVSGSMQIGPLPVNRLPYIAECCDQVGKPGKMSARDMLPLFDVSCRQPGCVLVRKSQPLHQYILAVLTVQSMYLLAK